MAEDEAAVARAISRKDRTWQLWLWSLNRWRGKVGIYLVLPLVWRLRRGTRPVLVLRTSALALFSLSSVRQSVRTLALPHTSSDASQCSACEATINAHTHP
ncbi:hypothetical protein M405DRAFT_424853 [Rhizopogon salebrosus TDB-379]|nr:hypothetical protein M405DRAFT_424853 [Rhizopogon salebrosus TDB-379]